MTTVEKTGSVDVAELARDAQEMMEVFQAKKREPQHGMFAAALLMIAIDKYLRDLSQDINNVDLKRAQKIINFVQQETVQ